MLPSKAWATGEKDSRVSAEEWEFWSRNLIPSQLDAVNNVASGKTPSRERWSVVSEDARSTTEHRAAANSMTYRDARVHGWQFAG